MIDTNLTREVETRILECLKNNYHSLDLSGIGLPSIPDLHKLTHLQKLNLSNNNILNIENLETLENLNELNLSDNKITEIKNIDNLKQLKILDLTNNKIRKIENINHCILLETLFLGSNKIQEIQNLDNLFNLKEIYLFNNEIRLIENLDHLEKLDSIFLENNYIEKIQNLENQKNLKTLNLSGNNIKYIENLDNNNELIELIIHNNHLEDISGLKSLIKLSTLLIGGNSIKNIFSIENLKKLEIFSGEKNKIQDIKPLVKLRNLRHLALGHNHIESLDRISLLKNLNLLDLSNNLITEELEIKKLDPLRNLKKLHLHNNPIWKKFDIILDENWDNNHLDFYKNFIKEYIKYEEVLLPYNIILLGNHSAGKSTLLNMLINKKNKEESTHGLKIELSPQKNGDFPMCIYYDFGGQDFYHGIYRLFLKENSFKILIVNPEFNENKLRLENQATVHQDQQYVQDFNLKYWLKQLEFYDLYSNNISSLYLIESHYHKNNSKHWDYISSINKKTLSMFCNLDLRNNKSIDNIYLKNSLLNNTKEINLKVRVSSNKIKLMKDIIQDIKSKNKKNIEPIPILDLKNKYEDFQYPLSSFIRDLEQISISGLIFYDKNIANGNYVWLNPKSLVDQIYEKFLSKNIIKNQPKQGIIKKQIFDQLQINEHTIELLEFYNIIFKHQPIKENPSETEYIIPNYLPLLNKSDPIYCLSTFGFTKPNFTLKFLEFIPMGMINHLICFFGKQPDHKLFWRDFIIFTLSEGVKKPFRIMINLELSKLEINFFIEGSKEEFPIVSNYLFYCILRFYWSKHAKDKAPVSYHDFSFNKKYMHTPGPLKQIWMPFLESSNSYLSEKKYIPSDLYISLDQHQYVQYSHLIKQDKNQTRIEAFKINKASSPQKISDLIPIQPFNIFCNKEFTSMKKIFISYSRKDVEYKNTLSLFLKTSFESSGHEIWDCGELETGKWDDQIQSKLEQSDLVICMLSINFFASHYILEKELIPILKAAEEGKKQIMCVVVKNFPWDKFAQLGQKAELNNPLLKDKDLFNNEITLAKAEITNYQFLPYSYRPTSSVNPELIELLTPLNQLSESERDNVYVDIVNRVSKTLGI